MALEIVNQKKRNIVKHTELSDGDLVIAYEGSKVTVSHNGEPELFVINGYENVFAFSLSGHSVIEKGSAYLYNFVHVDATLTVNN